MSVLRRLLRSTSSGSSRSQETPPTTPAAEPSLLDSAQARASGLNVPPPEDARFPVPRPLVDHPLLDREGTAQSLLARLGGQPALLVLLTPSCPGCLWAATQLGDWQEALGPGLRVRPLVLGVAEATARAFPDLEDLWAAPGAEGMEWARTLGMLAAPSFAVVSGTGEVLADASGDYSTPEAVLALVR